MRLHGGQADDLSPRLLEERIGRTGFAERTHEPIEARSRQRCWASLKQALEHRFGAALAPLNGGQIYTTLQRLERDGLVRGEDVPGDSRQKRLYFITDAGSDALRDWVAAPTAATRQRNEFFLKLVLAGLTGIADPRALVDGQRREYLIALRSLGERETTANDPVASLLAEGAALHLEADLRWLDLCETKLIRKDDHGNSTHS